MSHTSKIIIHSMKVAAYAAIFLCIVPILYIGCVSTSKEAHPVEIVAHRGGADLAPENTLAAFSSALKHDSDMIELDIHLSRDGVLMVTHDPLLARLTMQEGSVSDYTSLQLGLFDAASTYNSGGHTFGFQKIPTLAEVIEFVEAHATKPMHYQIEIKVKDDKSRYEGIEQKLLDTLEAYGILYRSIAISFDFPTLLLLGDLAPELSLGALISKGYFVIIGSDGPKAVAAHIHSLGVDYVGIKHTYLTQVLYDEFRFQGLGIGVWTVNDRSTMRKFIEMGVDFITTNRPDLLSKVREQ